MLTYHFCEDGRTLLEKKRHNFCLEGQDGQNLDIGKKKLVSMGCLLFVYTRMVLRSVFNHGK